jgi:hypothetical protein
MLKIESLSSQEFGFSAEEKSHTSWYRPERKHPVEASLLQALLQRSANPDNRLLRKIGSTVSGF